MFNLKSKISEYIRVLQVARKPTRDEFISSSKVCAIGMFVVGFLGLIIFLVFILLRL